VSRRSSGGDGINKLNLMIGIIAGIIGIAGFFGLQSFRQLTSDATPTTTPTNLTRAMSTYRQSADKRCGEVVLAGRKEIDPLEGATPSPQWAAAVGKHRAMMLQRWRDTPRSNAYGDAFAGQFGESMSQLWSDYASANQWWDTMAAAFARNDTAEAYKAYQQFKAIDARVIPRASDLGFSQCNHEWAFIGNW
jgi:hypothetical protein